MEQNCNCGCGCGGSANQGCCRTGHGNKGLIAIVLIVLAIFLVGLARNTFKQYDYIGKTGDTVKNITFSGEGKEVVKPDIAIVSAGVEIEKKTVAEAIKEGTDKMNAFITEAQKLGAKREDMRTTNYSISPAYDWKDGKQTLRGYTHRQNVELKIRDLEKVSEVLTLSGNLGLNQVGDLRFDVDNKEAAIAKAREAAISKAKANAELTAKQLGVKLGRITGYYTSEPNPPTVYNGAPMYKMAVMEAGSVPSPTVVEGQSEITITVNLTYDIL